MIAIIGALLLGHGVGTGLSYYMPPEWPWLRFWHFRVAGVPYYIYPLVMGVVIMISLAIFSGG